MSASSHRPRTNTRRLPPATQVERRLNTSPPRGFSNLPVPQCMWWVGPPDLVCGPPPALALRRPTPRPNPGGQDESGDALVEEMAGGAGVVRVIGSGRSFPVGAEHRQTACQQASPPPHPEASALVDAAHTAKRVGEVAATPAGPSPRRRTLRPPYTAVSPTRIRRQKANRDGEG